MSSPSSSPPSSPSAKKRKLATVNTPPATPKKSAGPAKAGTWPTEYDTFILASKKAGNTLQTISKAFSAGFGVDRTANAITKRLAKLNAQNVEWSEEMETTLKEVVTEYKSKDVYSTIAKVCKSKGGDLGELKQEAVVVKLKEMERAGVIEKLQ